MTVEVYEPESITTAEFLNQLDIWAQALALPKPILSLLPHPGELALTSERGIGLKVLTGKGWP